MKSCSAKELKTHTGEILRQVGSGEKILITKRGKPCAVLSPVENSQVAETGIRPFQEAWADIEKTLKTSQPQFETWQEAMRWSRSRS
jgi:prevent-host-death family protein